LKKLGWPVIFEVWMRGKNRARTLKGTFKKCKQTFTKFQATFKPFFAVLDNFNSYRRLPNVQTKRLIHILSKLLQVEVSLFFGEEATQEAKTRQSIFCSKYCQNSPNIAKIGSFSAKQNLCGNADAARCCGRCITNKNYSHYRSNSFFDKEP
jgi:hypothetical protein